MTCTTTPSFCVRTQTGQVGGDLWMEHKGKANVPGPEQRRGRADLKEIVQQSSNPYRDGRSLGDNWLEAKGKRWVVDCFRDACRCLWGEG